MGRARRKPAKPPVVGDTGPDTPAAMAGCTIEPLEQPGKATVRRKYRDHLLEVMAKPRVYRGVTRPPMISQRQRDAGIALHDAWCETQRGGGPIKEYVQTSPDWDAIITSNIERIWAFSDIDSAVPRHCRDIVMQVCIQQIAAHHGVMPDEGNRRMVDLHEGLTAVADWLKL